MADNRAAQASAVKVTREELVTMLMGFARMHHARFGQRALQVGLTIAQAKALYFLEENGASMRELADRMHCDASNVTGIVDRLQQLELLRRVADPNDRRLRLLELTAAGQRIRAFIADAMFDVPGLDRLSEDDQQILGRLIHAVVDTADLDLAVLLEEG